MPLPTIEEKHKFVADLVTDVTDRVLKLIEDNKIPAEWDGHELRQLLADHFAHQVSKGVMTGKRLKDYKNVVAVNNL